MVIWIKILWITEITETHNRQTSKPTNWNGNTIFLSWGNIIAWCSVSIPVEGCQRSSSLLAEWQWPHQSLKHRRCFQWSVIPVEQLRLHGGYLPLTFVNHGGLGAFYPLQKNTPHPQEWLKWSTKVSTCVGLWLETFVQTKESGEPTNATSQQWDRTTHEKTFKVIIEKVKKESKGFLQ